MTWVVRPTFPPQEHFVSSSSHKTCIAWIEKRRVALTTREKYESSVMVWFPVISLAFFLNTRRRC